MESVLAYLFWHWPWPEIPTDVYERNLIGFHETLAASTPPEGFLRSATFRIEGALWAGSEPRVYEDWYLTRGSFALDPLNEAAVSGRRKEPHDAAAHAAAGGAGGLYRLKAGNPEITGSGSAIWLTKPSDMSYEDFYARLEPWTEQPDTILWRRQMVLGPAPEFCMLGSNQHLPAVFDPFGVDRHLIWPPLASG